MLLSGYCKNECESLTEDQLKAIAAAVPQFEIAARQGLAILVDSNAEHETEETITQEDEA